MRGVDFSWARPGGAAIKAAGFDFAIRYVPYPGHGGKGLSVAEIDDLHANGVSIAMVYESTAERPLAGYDAGVFDATATQRAFDALGIPDSRPCYFAVDFDAQPGQYSVIDAYLQGAASVMGSGRIGVYGSHNMVKHCHDYGTARWFWQALAWSGGRHFDGRHLYQSLNGQFINGGEVDFNEAYAADFGQWPVEDEVTREEMDALKARLDAIELGVWSGSEEKDAAGNLIPVAERLTVAQYRRDEIAKGNAQSIAQRATQANLPRPVTVPPHDHEYTGRTAKS